MNWPKFGIVTSPQGDKAVYFGGKRTRVGYWLNLAEPRPRRLGLQRGPNGFNAWLCNLSLSHKYHDKPITRL